MLKSQDHFLEPRTESRSVHLEHLPGPCPKRLSWQLVKKHFCSHGTSALSAFGWFHGWITIHIFLNLHWHWTLIWFRGYLSYGLQCREALRGSTAKTEDTFLVASPGWVCENSLTSLVTECGSFQMLWNFDGYVDVNNGDCIALQVCWSGRWTFSAVQRVWWETSETVLLTCSACRIEVWWEVPANFWMAFVAELDLCCGICRQVFSWN